MAIPSASTPYTGAPSVQTALDGSGAVQSGVHANSDEFGGQVAGSIEKAGGEGAQQALKFQGLINETATNNAEVGFVKATGDLRAKYMQYEGLQSEAMRPQYESELSETRNKFREGLPLLAQHAFDATTTHQLALQTNEYSSYAAGQVKQANYKSLDSLADTAVAGAGNLSIVLDDRQLGNLQGTILHSAAAAADNKGWAAFSSGQDPDTGKLTFADNPEGQASKAQYDAYLNNKMANLYMTAAKTVADNQGGTAAANWAQKHWDNMPDVAKVEMNKFLAPKVKNETISGNVSSAVTDANSGFAATQLASVPSGPTAQTSASPLDVIRQNEGYTGKIGKDSNGANVLNGINEKSFPAEYAEAKNLLDTKGKVAADAYADTFYQKNIIDKYDIKSLPPATQNIVADGLVNHGAGTFGQSLIDAAKNGATPQQLIDMRRGEYKRLADSDTDGSKGYASSLNGWNNRLDSLQKGVPLPGTPINAPNKADYLRDNMENLVSSSVERYNKNYPDDYYGAQLQEKRTRTELSHQITIEDGKLKADRDAVVSAISGNLTKGQIPATYEELRAIPNMPALLDKVHSEQGQFAGAIDTMIAKASRRDSVSNSPNSFDVISRTLQPQDDMHPNHIKTSSQLDGLLGRSDGTGINIKDYNDAKPATELPTVIKEPLLKQMQQIATANGNIDGKGQQRAVQWYNNVMTAYKQNQSLGEKAVDDATFASHIGEAQGPVYSPPTPSRMTQISNWAKEVTHLGHVLVENKDGVKGYIPAGNVDKAIATGYKKVE